MLDGPYSGSAMRAWNCRHALFIAGGIGVTPFASLLQSLVSRYHSSMNACPHCHQSCCTNVPSSLGKLRHVSYHLLPKVSKMFYYHKISTSNQFRWISCGWIEISSASNGSWSFCWIWIENNRSGAVLWRIFSTSSCSKQAQKQCLTLISHAPVVVSL